MQERTTSAIALRPAFNAQGAYFFVILTSGQILNQQSFAPLPLPQDVINGVHRLTLCNPKYQDIRDRDWRPLLEPEDGENNNGDDSTYAPSDNDSSDNKYESEENQKIHNNLNPALDQ